MRVKEMPVVEFLFINNDHNALIFESQCYNSISRNCHSSQGR